MRFSKDVIIAARQLLGQKLVRTVGKQVLVGKIVETEAYHQSDPASHSYRGRTPRTEVMFGPPGCAYVYFTYGMHWCFNISVGPVGEGAAVLIRAVEPLEGIEQMRRNRVGTTGDQDLTNGPAKLTQALAINKELNGHILSKPPLRLTLAEKVPSSQIVTGTRIGISAAVEELWRFYIKGNPYVSRK